MFTEALQHAQAIDWKRVVFCIQNWLADIAIKQGKLDTAQRLLNQGLQEAKVNQDKCRIAFCQRSLSELAKAKEDSAEARRQAKEALKNFENLGMLPEAEEARVLLLTLNPNVPEPYQQN